APADVGLLLFHSLRGLLALLLFHFVELGLELLDRLILVLVLGTLVLTLHDDARGLVGQADGGIGLVDVLTSGAAGTIGVHAYIRHVQLDLNIIIHFRGNKHGGEGGVPAVAGVEGGLAYQTVNAGLGAQPAEGILAVDVNGGALDAGNLAGGDFHHLDIESLVLAPAQVHAQQHLGPVLRLGAAGTGLDVDESAIGVHLAGEHAAEFQLLQLSAEAVKFAVDLVEQVFVVLFLRQL